MDANLNLFSAYKAESEYASESDLGSGNSVGRPKLLIDLTTKFSSKQTGSSPLLFGQAVNQGLWSQFSSDKGKNFFETLNFSEGSPYNTTGSEVDQEGKNPPPPSKFNSKSLSTGENRVYVSDPYVLTLDNKDRNPEFPYVGPLEMGDILANHVDESLYLIPDCKLKSANIEEKLRETTKSGSLEAGRKPDHWVFKTPPTYSYSKIDNKISFNLETNQEDFSSGKKEEDESKMTIEPFSISQNEHPSSDRKGTYFNKNEMDEEPLRSPENAQNQKPSFDKQTIELMLKRGIKHRMIIIDCRYFYEFEGGHITGAINISSPLVINHLMRNRKEMLFNNRFLDMLLATNLREITFEDIEEFSSACSAPQGQGGRVLRQRAKTQSDFPVKDSSREAETEMTDSEFNMHITDVIPILVLHCEFSSQRGPNIFRHVRSVDRGGNPYPFLTFPQMYVLKGGYEAFYKDNLDRCTPNGAYVPMYSTDWKQSMRRYETKVSEEWKTLKRTK